MITEIEHGQGAGRDTGVDTGIDTVPLQRSRKKARINYALAGTLLASGMSYDDIAAKCGAKTGESLRTGLSRKGVTKRSVTTLPIPDERMQSATMRSALAGAEIIRERLNGRLAEAVSALGTKSVTYRDLANQGQGHAAVLKTLAETHKALNGAAETQVLVFGVDQIAERRLEPAQAENDAQWLPVNCGG